MKPCVISWCSSVFIWSHNSPYPQPVSQNFLVFFSSSFRCPLFHLFLRCAGWVKWLMYYTCIHIPHIRPWTWNGGENVQRVLLHSGSLKIPSLADGVCSVVALLRKCLVTFMSHHCPTGFSTIFFWLTLERKKANWGIFLLPLERIVG